MEIMNQHGISTPKCFVASTPEEADHIFSTMMNKRKFDAHARVHLFLIMKSFSFYTDYIINQ